MNTYWLLGRKDFNKPLPNFDKLFAEDKQQAIKLPVTVGKTVRLTSNPLRPSVESGYSDGMHGSSASVQANKRMGDNKGQSHMGDNKEVTLSDIRAKENNADKMTDVKSEVTAMSTIGSISPKSTPGVERKNGLPSVQVV